MQTTLETQDQAPPRISGRARWLLPVAQLAAVLAAGALGWHGYQLVYDSRGAIDEAARWYALALLLLAFAAWDGAIPRARPSIAGIRAWPRAHAIELTVLAAVIAAGVFMRLFRFGDLPPNGYIILEEHINGGATWDIIHGARPYIYPSSRYAGALSQWIFGPTTTGLRAHTVAAGILSIPFFYVLMRELVTWRAALFATAIFASLRILGETSTHFETPMLVTIVTVWLAVRGLRTRNVIWLVPAAFLCAVLSYEYETWKAVPLFLGAFAVFLALRGLFLPIPRSAETVVERARRYGPFAARTFVVVSIAVLMGLGPMFAEKHRGQDIYFGSLERQERDRDNAGTPGQFSPEAREHVKWSFQVYTPWVKPDYVVLGPVPTRGVIDRVTSVLLWAALGVAALTFWRGYRALFVGWFVGGAIIAGMLLSAWAAWKLVGFLPPAIVLIGFLADDALRIAERTPLTRRWGVPALLAVFVALAAIAFTLNLRVQNANANDERVLREYGNLPSQMFSLCSNLRDRPDGTYAVAAQRVRTGTPFTRDYPTARDEALAWSDFRFVCDGLEGTGVPDLQEAWPLYIDRDGPISLAAVGGADEIGRAIDALARAIPELGAPDTLRDSPGNTFQTILFDTNARELEARKGLVLRRGSGDANGTVAAGPEFRVTGASAGGWELSGLVLLPEEINGTLVVDGLPAGARIEVDGDASSANRALITGWHIVRVSGTDSPAGPLRMRWQRDDGVLKTIEADQFFALADLHVWRHTRTYLTPSRMPALRYDFSPHFAAVEGFRIGPGDPLPPGTGVADETWDARWTVPEDGTYRMYIWEPSGPFRLVIDGREVTNHAAGGLATVDVPLTRGDHSIEIAIMQPDGKPYIGALLRVTDPRGADLAMDIHPF